MGEPISVTVWSERTEDSDVYPNGINTTIAEYLNGRADIVATTASIDDPDQGVPQEVIDGSDVLIWWGHIRHDDVTDAVVERIYEAIEAGNLGFIALHSAHYARPFVNAIGTSGDLGDVRIVDGETERFEIVDPAHPIARGISPFALPQVEMFGEPFDIPSSASVVFNSHFSEGGEFRSGVTFEVGNGRVFYFRPGHETYRIFHDPNIIQVLKNAVEWASGNTN